MKPNAKPFEGASCEKRLLDWVRILSKKSGYLIVNRIDSDFIILVNLFLATDSKIIALGNNASKDLGKAPHFKLPHPSGKNRLLNDKDYIKSRLKECKKWLKTK